MAGISSGDWNAFIRSRTWVDSAWDGSHAKLSFFCTSVSFDAGPDATTTITIQKAATIHLPTLPLGIQANRPTSPMRSFTRVPPLEHPRLGSLSHEAQRGNSLRFSVTHAGPWPPEPATESQTGNTGGGFRHSAVRDMASLSHDAIRRPEPLPELRVVARAGLAGLPVLSRRPERAAGSGALRHPAACRPIGCRAPRAFDAGCTRNPAGTTGVCSSAGRCAGPRTRRAADQGELGAEDPAHPRRGLSVRGRAGLPRGDLVGARRRRPD